MYRVLLPLPLPLTPTTVHKQKDYNLKGNYIDIVHRSFGPVTDFYLFLLRAKHWICVCTVSMYSQPNKFIHGGNFSIQSPFQCVCSLFCWHKNCLHGICFNAPSLAHIYGFMFIFLCMNVCVNIMCPTERFFVRHPLHECKWWSFVYSSTITTTTQSKSLYFVCTLSHQARLNHGIHK